MCQGMVKVFHENPLLSLLIIVIIIVIVIIIIIIIIVIQVSVISSLWETFSSLLGHSSDNMLRQVSSQTSPAVNRDNPWS